MPPRKASSSSKEDKKEDPLYTSLLAALDSAGGSISSSVSLTQLPDQGRCCVASKDIPKGHDLFTIPRSFLLNTTNSALPGLCHAHDKEHAEEDEVNMSIDSVRSSSSSRNKAKNQTSQSKTKDAPKPPRVWADLQGWAPLILCMMWETWRTSNPANATAAKKAASDLGQTLPAQDWKSYLDIMPTDFSALPMFWSEEDLKMLKGTSVLERIGKDEADAEYKNNVRPFIASHALVFLGPAAHKADKPAFERLIDEHYSLDHFHLQGSRILSRSFHVKRGHAGKAVGEEDIRGDKDSDDGSESGSHISVDDSEEEEEEEEEQEDTADISMVPFADLLNASYASENAKLFYEASSVIMRSTCKIAKGEQIMNTYGDPPNADLLRRYGYVDLCNGADEVELTREHLEEVADGVYLGAERFDYLTHDRMDETYFLTYPLHPSDEPPHRCLGEGSPSEVEVKAALSDSPYDDELLLICRGLAMDENDFHDMADREGEPKSKLNLDTAKVLIDTLEVKLDEYEGGSSSQEDEERIYGNKAKKLSTNERNAIVVRLGEKRVLESHIALLRKYQDMEKKRQDDKERQRVVKRSGSQSSIGKGYGAKKSRH